MISVIVPALDEEHWLPRCLALALPQVRAIGGELLVVDGGSHDATCELARGAGARVVSGPRGRGVQMNLGARLSVGSLLVFLPADTLLPEGALDRLASIDRLGRPLAGGFRQAFDGDRRLLRIVSWVHNLRARGTGVLYGDQVPFVRRALFEKLGGFREDTDMEDVELGVRLRRHARPQLQPLTVTTSARRFERVGPIRATLICLSLMASWTWLRHVPRSKTFFTPVR